MLFSWDKKDLIDVCILFGGVSTEHKVSINSARNVYEAIDKGKYNVTLVGITKQGKWYIQSPEIFKKKDLEEIEESGNEVVLVPGSKGKLISISNSKDIVEIDVVFPVLHGFGGEDGSVQGLFKLVEIPFVGSSILGSCIGLDKDVTKRLLKQANVPIPNFMVFNDSERIDIDSITYKLGFPFVIKPSSLGSSIGVSIVDNKQDANYAIKDAFKYDKKIVAEEYIQARELECSVLGNQRPQVSCIGEVIPNDQFYTYSAKYSKESKAKIVIPAAIEDKTEREIRRLAFKTFRTLCCEGMARVDFFLKEDGAVLVNEINTIPGFTNISMYPKLWEKSGITYTQLIDRLIELAIDRYEREYTLKRTIQE